MEQYARIGQNLVNASPLPRQKTRPDAAGLTPQAEVEACRLNLILIEVSFTPQGAI